MVFTASNENAVFHIIYAINDTFACGNLLLVNRF